MTKKTKTQIKREAILAKSEAIIEEHAPAIKTNLGGRPPVFESSLELATQIEAYFLHCENRTKPFITKTGKVVEVKADRKSVV